MLFLQNAVQRYAFFGTPQIFLCFFALKVIIVSNFAEEMLYN